MLIHNAMKVGSPVIVFTVVTVVALVTFVVVVIFVMFVSVRCQM